MNLGTQKLCEKEREREREIYIAVNIYSVRKLIRSAKGINPSKLNANTHACFVYTKQPHTDNLAGKVTSKKTSYICILKKTFTMI